MNKPERDAAVKELGVELTNVANIEGAVQTGNYEYSIPVVVDGEDRVVTVTFTARLNKATVKNPAFNLEDARQAYLDDLAHKAEIAALKAASKK